MNLNEYQELAKGTALPGAWSLSYLVPGLAGETGELAEKFYGLVYSLEFTQEQMLAEVADHLWFAALICEFLDLQLEDLVRWGDYFDAMVDSYGHNKTPNQLLMKIMTKTGDANSAFAKSVRDEGGNLSEKRLNQILESVRETVILSTAFAALFDTSLEELMQSNLDKLYGRKERGTLGGDGDTR